MFCLSWQQFLASSNIKYRARYDSGFDDVSLGNGHADNFSVSSRDVELLNAIEKIAPGYMEPARPFRGGWYRLLVPVEPYNE